MRRVEADERRGRCSTPKDVPELPDLWGDEFDARLPRGRGGGPGRASRSRPATSTADDAHAGADRQRLDDLQGRRPTAPATRPREPGNVVHLSNLCTEILEVTTDDETAVCNLGSVNLGALRRRRRRVRLRPSSRDDRAHRRALPRPGHRHQLLPDRRRRRRSNPRWRPVGLGRDGPAGRLLPAAAAVRLGRGARAVDAGSPRRSTCTRCEASADLAERSGAAPGVRRDPRRARASCSSTSGASTPTQTGALGRAARADRARTACATRCWSRSRRPRPSPRSPAATSASSRRCPTCSSARRCRASSSRSTATWCAS